MPRSLDMTNGSIPGSMLRFSLPMMAGSLLQQCYNIADTMVVGRALGPDALAPLPAFGVTAIWAAVPIGWVLADLVGFGYYAWLMRGNSFPRTPLKPKGATSHEKAL